MAHRKKYEGSALDERRDRRQAKKRGMTMKDWEKSDMDKRMDKAGQKKLNKKRR